MITIGNKPEKDKKNTTLSHNELKAILNNRINFYLSKNNKDEKTIRELRLIVNTLSNGGVMRDNGIQYIIDIVLEAFDKTYEEVFKVNENGRFDQSPPMVLPRDIVLIFLRRYSSMKVDTISERYFNSQSRMALHNAVTRIKTRLWDDDELRYKVYAIDDRIANAFSLMYSGFKRRGIIDVNTI